MKRYLAFSFLTVVITLSLAGSALADGKADYTAKCASCHGADGKGKNAIAKGLKVELAAMDLTKPGVDCVKVLNEGKGKMASYKDKGIDIQAVCGAVPK